MHHPCSQQQHFAHKCQSYDPFVLSVIDHYYSASIGSSFGDYGFVSKAPYYMLVLSYLVAQSHLSLRL